MEPPEGPGFRPRSPLPRAGKSRRLPLLCPGRAGEGTAWRGMVENFLVVAGQVATLFLLIGVGFILARLGVLTPEGTSQMSTLVLYMVTPCIMTRSFETPRAPGMVETLSIFLGAYALCTLLGILLAQLCFRREPLDQRGPLRFGAAYGNNGFMGLPLVIAVLGSEAAIFGAVSATAFNLFLWTQGLRSMGGTITPRSALVNPATVGTVIGLTLFLTGWRPPEPVNNAISALADLNTPLPMIILGAQMARADLRAALADRRIWLVAAVRLLAAPLIAMVVLLPLRLEPMSYCACVVLCAVPPAGATSMMAQRFGRDTALAAESISAVTLLSLLTLPLFATVALQLSGLG